MRALKGAGRPLVPAAERAEVVASLACVDYVQVFEEKDVASLLRAATLPLAPAVMAPLRLPGSQVVVGAAARALGVVGHDLALDRAELARVLNSLRETEAVGAFTRTLRAAVDWRGQLVTMLDRAYLTRLFRETAGDLEAMAAALGVKVSGLYLWLRRARIDIRALRRLL